MEISFNLFWTIEITMEEFYNFEYQRDLEEIQSAINEEKKFTCHHCDKKFRRKTQLKNHEKIHTNEKPYTCYTNVGLLCCLVSGLLHAAKLNHLPGQYSSENCRLAVLFQLHIPHFTIAEFNSFPLSVHEGNLKFVLGDIIRQLKHNY